MKKLSCSGTEFQKRCWGRCSWDLLHKPVHWKQKQQYKSVYFGELFVHRFVFPVLILEGVSLSLTIHISVLMFSCHFLTWQMWIALGTQAPAICLVQVPQMAKPALAAVLGMDTVSVLLCSAANALLPGLLPHWKGKVELTGVCRLEKCIGFLLLSTLWRKRGESVAIFFGSQL